MSATATIISKFGVPGAAYQAQFCELWEIQKDFNWFPASRILINKDFKAELTLAFAALEVKGFHKEIKTFDGCYNDRSVRGRSSTSLHAWALAIDLNASAEKLGQGSTHWSQQFIDTMTSNGIFWGGTWHRPDPMHFALYNG